MRALMATWMHPGDYIEAAARGGAAFAQQWPTPPPPIDVPAGCWLALDGTPDYPRHLTAAPAAPLVLFGRGNLDAVTAPGLAVVGTRDITAYGSAVAQTSAAACPAGHPVISGLAAGVDATAHEAALAAGAPTVAVLPTGVDQVYPESHADLARRIVAAGGALVSEQPFGTGTDSAPGRTPAPLPSRLVARNRVIAGLAAALVVAEASPGSGSLHAVWAMLDMGRTVLTATPRPNARSVPGARVPIALSAAVARSADTLRAMGAPPAVVQKWANRSEPMAGGVARDRDELATLVVAAVLLSSANDQ